MDELRDRLRTARLSNWEHWPTVREMWPWFAALGLLILIAVPWGIRAEERSLESSSREALADAGIAFEDISFTGRQATIVSNLSTNEQIAAVSVLAEMGGVSRISWEEAGGPDIDVPPTTFAPTTTVTPEPGAEMTFAVNDGEITLRGVVPSARIVKDVNDAAQAVWGGAIVNQMFVDGSVLAHSWLGRASDAIPVLAGLVDPQLALDHEGATLTGAAVSEEILANVLDRLSVALGPDVAIDSKVTVTQLDLPSVQIVFPGDGTVDVTGIVSDAGARRSIVSAIVASSDEIEANSTLRVSDTTADVYLMRRLPDVIATLSASEQWTLQFDGESLGGTAVGGKAFTGNRVKPTAQVADLLAVISSLLAADPNLTIAIEVHADPRDGDAAATDLATDRAAAVASQLVRLGIEPERVSAGAGPGEGELLRFLLVPAEK